MQNPNPNQTDQTTPSSYRPNDSGGLKAPPKLLFYGCVFLFLLGIVGTVGSVLAFREALRPAQQQRVVDILPFMQAFLPPAPPPDATVPTSLAPVDDTAVENLLFGDFGFSETSEEAIEVEDEAATDVVTDVATDEPPPTEEDEASVPAFAGGGTQEQQAVAQAPTSTPTLAPTLAPTSTPTLPPVQPSAAPTIDVAAAFAAAESQATSMPPQTWPAIALNTGFRWESQGWNNCGPATITTAMSYYGWTRSSTYARERLRPNSEDRNVSPHELVRYVTEESQLGALWRYGGDLDMMRRLVSAGFPVVIERSHMFAGYEWLGHYQAIIGYNDNTRQFSIMDSFLGQNNDGQPITETYDEVDAGWREFNRVFIVLYRPEEEAQVMRLMGAERNTLEASAEYAATVAQADARRNRNDAFAWFNIGTSLTEVGMYEEAARAYDQATALQQIPWRMYWYQFGIFEAYYQVGRYDDVMQLVQTNLSNVGGRYVEETYYWQGKVMVARGDIAGARAAFNRALSYNRFYTDAREALNALG
ncbi:MAG: hypothetical protein GFH27_549367n29 [Chloroflexi bacterium AL-W]|nr:hypothetical protein [Chloroflexi bacterium AL-W]